MQISLILRFAFYRFLIDMSSMIEHCRSQILIKDDLMPKVLMISKYLPPMFDIGGKRAYKFAKYLPSLGWTPVLFVAKIPEGKAIDDSLAPLDEKIKIYHEYIPTWFKESQNNLSDATIQRHTKPKSKLSLWLDRCFAWPVDRHLILSLRNAWVLKKIVEQENISVIWATSAPYSSLVFGALLKWLTQKPLCLDLRDPWTLNFLEKKRPNWVKTINQWVEKKVITYADQVLFTAESTTNAYREKYKGLVKENHFQTITNAFDPEIKNAIHARDISQDQFRLVHFGNCYGPRRLIAILEALVYLRDKMHQNIDRFELLNLGKISDEDLEFAQQHQLIHIFKFQRAVPYVQGLEILAQAQLQILMAYGDETLFIPAKFFDYLLTGAKILCISQPSELTQYIEETQTGHHFTADQIEDLARFMNQEYLNFQNKIKISIDQASIDRFSAIETTKQFVKILDSLQK
jgi:hypothetical protein